MTGPCVRCGVNPRAPELFVCYVCRADPNLRREMASAEAVAATYGDQRVALMVKWNWAGGWPRMWPPK